MDEIEAPHNLKSKGFPTIVNIQLLLTCYAKKLIGGILIGLAMNFLKIKKKKEWARHGICVNLIF